MAKEEILEFSAIVSELLPNANFLVQLIAIEDNSSDCKSDSDSDLKFSGSKLNSKEIDFVSRIGKSKVIAYTSGRMRKHRIRISVGDRVKLEISPCDMTRARITYRFK